MNQELPGIQAGFRKGKGTRNQIANIHWIIEKARESQKNVYPCFINYTKAFDYVDHNQLWKTLKEMGVSDDPTCLLRNLYAVKKKQLGPVWNNWLVQDWESSTTRLLLLCLFNWQAGHIMKNAGLDELQARIKIGRRNTNNLSYVENITLMAESE